VTGRHRLRGLELLAASAGVAAFIALAVACAGGALAYTGAQGEPYSPLNHWISELGQLGVSEGAELFNSMLMVGGGAFGLFVTGLAMTSPSRLRWVFGPAGIVAGIGGIFVGVYPMNAGGPHVLSASIFFLLGWIFVAIASLAFVRGREPRHPAWLALVGVVAALSTLAFLVSLRVDPTARSRMASSGPIIDRPDVWVATILEWASLLSIMAWVLLTSVAWLRQLVRESGEATA
jgi:hypothetical membrane protein